MQVHRGVEYKVPVSAEVEAAFIAADVDGSGFICIYCMCVCVRSYIYIYIYTHTHIDMLSLPHIA